MLCSDNRNKLINYQPNKINPRYLLLQCIAVAVVNLVLMSGV